MSSCPKCNKNDWAERTIYDDWEHKLTCSCGHRELVKNLGIIMPYMTGGKRDYKKEYQKFHSRPEEIANRSERTTARRAANADGRTSKGDGTNLDHRKPLSKGGTSARSNLRVVSESSNKSFSRNKDGSMKSQTSKRERKKK